MARDELAPKIGIVSLGCPKATVDSERIITKLRSDGYLLSPTYEDADAVIVNTCGFLDSAREESLSAIGDALDANGRVIVTGCLGAEPETIMKRHPKVLAITGAHQYEAVVKAVHEAVPPVNDPYAALIPESGLRLTPRHYAYLKISEGCNNKCSFCIIPDMRGKLASRPIASVLYEAESLVKNGVKELLVISQDTSAYGVDIKYEQSPYHKRMIEARFQTLCEELGKLGGCKDTTQDVWVRLHYVYPYPHVDHAIPLMNEGLILPYIDIPFQHASPAVLKNMRRPGKIEKTAERILNWRKMCPDITIRSTFIVGFPGETEEDFELLLDWMRETKIERAGCFKYENVKGARSAELENHVPEEIKQERWDRFMQVQQEISAANMASKVGQTTQVLVDEYDDENNIYIARSKADAPEIDGNVFIENFDNNKIKIGDFATVKITDNSEYDLYADQT
jgi:ribosomal protein S12 methylthiotransferase